MPENINDILAEMREYAWNYVQDSSISRQIESYANRIEDCLANNDLNYEHDDLDQDDF